MKVLYRIAIYADVIIQYIVLGRAGMTRLLNARLKELGIPALKPFPLPMYADERTRERLKNT